MMNPLKHLTQVTLTLTLIGLSSLLYSQDLGPQGQLFPIIEEDIQKALHDKIVNLLNSEVPNDEDKERLQDKILHPPTVSALTQATTYRHSLYDPSLTLKEDIRTHEGLLIAEKGKRINPLEEMTLDTALLFIDGDNESHLNWARSQGDDDKWILVSGSPIPLEERELRPIYYDQSGLYAKKFQIQAIPARISQKGTLLLIEEIPLKDGKSCS